MNLRALWLVLALLMAPCTGLADVPIRIASKTFTESHVLGEIAAQLLESRGFEVQRRLGLGGTLIAYEALRGAEIDLYPEYSGTLTETVLDQPGLDLPALRQALAERQLTIGAVLGFNNTYAIAVPQQLAQRLGLRRISDLARQPRLRAGFSHEFLNRGDGWPALRESYQLPQRPVGIEHALAYPALREGQLDLTDAYSTDGELQVHALTLLQDDRGFFPRYEALLLARQDLPAPVLATLAELRHTIDEATMRRLNHAVAAEGRTPAEVASEFLSRQGLVQARATRSPTMAQRIGRNLLAHLQLTGAALLLACLIAIPLALLLSRREGAARVLLYVCGLFQTIPALALLALLIPLVGLGQLPAIIALFLYSLLPIVRNTLTGLFSVDPLLKQVARGMGLTAAQQLWRVELPLAVPTLLAGVKTAAIISIGTATLAAFVGAGGLGEPIITGLNLNDHGLILEGAIPAALLAIAVELLFELLERLVVPVHLRQQ